MPTAEGITEGFVNVHGLRLHYVDWGNAARPDLLLVHGWDGNAHYWDLVAPSFRDRFHVVALTLRGRGKSDEDPTGEYPFESYITDIWEATQQLGLQHMIFVGASLGGMIALPYIVQHQEQVEKLVLGDIGAQLGGDGPSSYHQGMMDAPDHFDSLHEVEAWLRQWSLYVKIPSQGMAIILREHFRETSDGRWTWTYLHKLREIRQRQSAEKLFPTQWHVLPRIACPVLIIRGGRSESLFPNVAERTRSELPNATLVEIPDCAHFPYLEAPEKFTKALSDFIG